jgi:hypothetical protein
MFVSVCSVLPNTLLLVFENNVLAGRLVQFEF